MYVFLHSGRIVESSVLLQDPILKALCYF